MTQPFVLAEADWDLSDVPQCTVYHLKGRIEGYELDELRRTCIGSDITRLEVTPSQFAALYPEWDKKMQYERLGDLPALPWHRTKVFVVFDCRGHRYSRRYASVRHVHDGIELWRKGLQHTNKWVRNQSARANISIV